jgi:hypothetical protein
MKGWLAAAAAVLCAACATVEDTAEPPKPRPVVTAPHAEVTPPAPAPAVPQPGPERSVPAEPRISETEMLLADFERLRRLPPADLAREQDAARQAFGATRSDAARVRLAMVWTVPGTAPADEQRALEHLEPLLRNTAAPLHSLAFLLSSYIQEQRRLATLVQGLQQNAQTLQQNNQTLQQNVHALQQKLDALRTLERSLTERGEPAPRRR